MPTVPPNEIGGLSALPNNSTINEFTTSNTPLAEAEIFEFRVPHSTIELHVTTTTPIDGQILGSTLLRIHEYINDEISRHGDGPLGLNNDPFVWRPFAPPSTIAAGLMTNNLPLELTVEGVPGKHMTWSVLLIAVEGLAVGSDFGTQFEIWDWRDQAQWAFGEVKKVNPVAGESVGTARVRRSAQEVMPGILQA